MGAENFNSGDIAWMLISTGLVLLMIPALGFFEAGMIRMKNSINVIMQMWTGVCVLSVVWYCWGFSLVFGEGKFIGSLKYGFMVHVPVDDIFADYDPTMTIPAFLFAAFQMQFFAITPLLISGAWVERFKWKPFLVFIVCWDLIVYCFVAHWVWGKGFMYDWGVIDFAGGIVIHTTAGVSSLVTALMLGRRSHFTPVVSPLEVNEAHNIPLSVLGAGMLWFGWFGFNGGSAGGANQMAVIALFNSHIASSTAGVTWLIIGMFREKRASSVGIITGSVGGLACITPAAGFVRTHVAFGLGFVAGLASYASIYLLKEKLRIDDALDVSSVHGLTGMIGSIAAGIFASKTVNPLGPDMSGKLVGYQFLAVLIAGVWGGFWTFAILFVMKFIPGLGLRTSLEKEEEGLDTVYHKETAYQGMDSIYSKEGGSIYAKRMSLIQKEGIPIENTTTNTSSALAVGSEPQQQSGVSAAAISIGNTIALPEAAPNVTPSSTPMPIASPNNPTIAV